MGREPDDDESLVTMLRDEDQDAWNHRKETTIHQLSINLINGDLNTQIEAARDIRKFVRKSSSKTRSKFADAGVIQPLVNMLLSPNLDARHASVLALLNLAVRNERNKIDIVKAGAITPLVELLNFQNSDLRELAAAAILTLSAAAPNKSAIISSGVAPLLVQILISGSVQGQVDAVTALHNLCTHSDESTSIVDAKAVSPLIDLLKECKKYSKFAEKASALLEILSNSEEGRIAITNSNGGILTLVETVEDGSLISMEHAVGALLSLCRSCRVKYRELILKEGAIPGLLRLTVEGTFEAQRRAHALLDMLRDNHKEKIIPSSVFEKIVYENVALAHGRDNNKTVETARSLLQDMVKKSMELTMTRIQLRAASSTPSKVPFS